MRQAVPEEVVAIEGSCARVQVDVAEDVSIGRGDKARMDLFQGGRDIETMGDVGFCQGN